MLINILGTFAQLERETIGERTSLALRHKRDRLEVYASVPYGFTRAGDRLHPHDRELGIVGRIYGLRAQGQSLRQIAASLNSARICTKLGRRWAPEQIRLILARASVYERFLTRATETGR